MEMKAHDRVGTDNVDNYDLLCPIFGRNIFLSNAMILDLVTTCMYYVIN